MPTKKIIFFKIDNEWLGCIDFGYEHSVLRSGNTSG